MRPVMLSGRMQTVAGMVTEGNAVCDVGCDHGFVSIYLVEQGISPRAIAMDLREGPLRAAAAHVAEHGLADRIETRLSDGLHKYRIGEADALICAGMGGGLMMQILTEEKEKTDSFRELVLQPQSEIEQFRRFLRENGYHILDEEILREDGKFYQVMRAVPRFQDGPDRAGEFEEWEAAGIPEYELCKLVDRYGPVLLRKKTPVFLSFLEREAAIYEEILEKLERQGLTDEKRRNRYAEIEQLLRENALVRQIL